MAESTCGVGYDVAYEDLLLASRRQRHMPTSCYAEGMEGTQTSEPAAKLKMLAFPRNWLTFGSAFASTTAPPRPAAPPPRPPMPAPRPRALVTCYGGARAHGLAGPCSRQGKHMTRGGAAKAAIHMMAGPVFVISYLFPFINYASHSRLFSLQCLTCKAELDSKPPTTTHGNRHNQ